MKSFVKKVAFNFLDKNSSHKTSSYFLYNGTVRFFSDKHKKKTRNFKMVVVGGGTGGTGIAHKFARTFQKDLAVIEPSEVHYYQPLFTLVGGGLKDFEQTHSTVEKVLPKSCTWIKDKAVKFDPQNNTVTIGNGEEITYDYLVVATGLKLALNKVKGLEEAIENDPNVVSIYSPTYVKKVHSAIKQLQSGNAVFTYPDTPVKCAGAAQKICYLAEEHFRKAGNRDKINVNYRTSLPAIFGIPKYANALTKLAQQRNINVATKSVLVEVKPDSKEAVFKDLSNPDKLITINYSLLHVTPPMTSLPALASSELSDHSGFLKVDPSTLQHTTYPNVFGIGDCINAPTAKTAAAVASQLGVVGHNLRNVMKGLKATRKYDGYTSCPIVINSKQVILAEFGYDGKVLETFPLDGSKPRRMMYWLKAHGFPFIYWNFLIKGLWHGPGFVRKLWSFQ